MLKATARETRLRSSMGYRRPQGTEKCHLVQFLPLDRSQRMYILTFLSLLRLDQIDELYRWKSLFFYRFTDQISFAPLRSQGVDSRSNYILEKTAAAAPPPCSPKSIYVLANLVRRPSAGSRP